MISYITTKDHKHNQLINLTKNKNSYTELIKTKRKENIIKPLMIALAKQIPIMILSLIALMAMKFEIFL